MVEATQPSLNGLAEVYYRAKSCVIEAGYSEEIAWQNSVSLDEVTAESFLSEAAWVIMSAGMSERVVSACFPRIATAFGGFESLNWIVARASSCIEDALEHFNHRPKIEAIATIAALLERDGADSLIAELQRCGPEALVQLPYIGPVTSYHLAKNLGVAVPKPDRHLVRLAAGSAFATVDAMCDAFASAVGEPTDVVDVVLWRACAMGALDPGETSL